MFDVRPCADHDEYGRAVNAIGQYFGGMSEEQVEQFERNLPHERMHAAFDGDQIVGGAGAFPSDARAQVVWIGIDEGQEDLAHLAGAVMRATEPFGFEPDHPEFTAHLTVARSPRARSMTGLVRALGDGPVGPRWDVTEVQLMESDTRPTGAVYREIDRFALRG